MSTLTRSPLPTTARQWEVLWDATAMLTIELLEERQLGRDDEAHRSSIRNLQAMRTALHSRWRNR